MPNTLRVNPVGTVYMLVFNDAYRTPIPGVGETTFPCTALEYTMCLNDMHKATVFLSSGCSLKVGQGAYVFPDFLVNGIKYDDQTSGSHSMFYCELWEEATGASSETSVAKKASTSVFASRGTDVCIFKGYILSSGLIYKSGADSSNVQVRVDCVGLAGDLLTSPFTAYVDTYVSYVIDSIVKNSSVSIENAVSSGITYSINKDMLKSLVTAYALHKSIIYRVALCTGAGRLFGRMAEVKPNSEALDQSVLIAFGGRTNLNYPVLGDACDFEYTESMYESIIEGLKEGDVFDAIKSTLTSPQFALQLIPRIHCDTAFDFKIDIAPVTAWKPRHPIFNIPMKYVKEFKMAHSNSAVLNTPDVLMVNLTSILSFTAGDAAGGCAIYGVAAGNEELDAQLKAAITKNDISKISALMQNVRVKSVQAPKWLAAVAYTPNVINIKSEQGAKKSDTDKEGSEESEGSSGTETTGAAAANAESAENTEAANAASTTDSTHLPESVADEPEDQTGSTTAPEVVPGYGTAMDTLKTAYDYASMMARVLYDYFYLADDTAILELTPDVRFGNLDGRWLEDSIGDTVQLDFADNMLGSTDMVLYGVIRSVTYRYASGQASSISYTLVLERIRFSSASVPTEESPIYTT